MSRLKKSFEEYAAFHQTAGNQRTHMIGIPMIVVAVFAWGARWVWFSPVSTQPPLSLFQFDLAVLMIALSSFWYLWCDWRVALPFIPVLYGTYWLGRCLSCDAAWALFILGWIFQIIGHVYYEKKSPAFMKNLQHLLIGPIWIFSKLLHL